MTATRSWRSAPRTPSPRFPARLAVLPLEDRSVPAAFDPTFGTGGALQVGGANAEAAFAMARDAAGDTYLVGALNGTTDFDPGPGTYPVSSQGDLDGFVAKYAPDGSLLWARGLGGVGFDKATAVAVDAAGGVSVGGQVTGSADLDPASSYPDNRDLIHDGAYVAHFAPDGSLAWVWQSSGGAPWSGVADLATDAGGNVFAVGSYPNPASSYVTCSVVKLAPAGAQQWRDDIAGSNGAFVGRGLALDGSGNVLMVGAINGRIDVDPGAGTTTLSSNTMSTVVEKLGPTGAFVWARQTAGSDRVEGYDVAVDASGAMYTGGYYKGKADFDPGKGTYNLTAPTAGGSYVSKLDAAGNFVWARGLGAGYNAAYQLALDAAGGVYLSGSFTGSGDFDPGAGTATLTSAGQTDAFVVKLDTAGSYQWSLRMGGSDYDYATGLAVDPNGDVYVAGYFYATADFGGTSLTSNGSADIFLAKIKQS